MPNRIIRDGILTSERVNSLSDRAELFYRRLMSVVDDFGRYYANPTILRASCYPLKLDTIKEDIIIKLLDECIKSGLLSIYHSEGKLVLQMTNFRQQVRANASKYPANDTQMLCRCYADAQQMISNAHLDGVVFGDGDAKRINKNVATPATRIGFNFETGWEGIEDSDLEEWRQIYPACNIEEQLNYMHAWIKANPNRGVKSNYARFINNWLKKAQDKGGK